ncbi:hypothetical protein BJ165DRAFT_760880 [Panaeolus papilionaceus]|nr:hypothetical protein BJ165DRAFT_760880 [Panaeolus papilionaceus]
MGFWVNFFFIYFTTWHDYYHDFLSLLGSPFSLLSSTLDGSASPSPVLAFSFPLKIIDKISFSTTIPVRPSLSIYLSTALSLTASVRFFLLFGVSSLRSILFCFASHYILFRSSFRLSCYLACIIALAPVFTKLLFFPSFFPFQLHFPRRAYIITIITSSPASTTFILYFLYYRPTLPFTDDVNEELPSPLRRINHSTA